MDKSRHFFFVCEVLAVVFVYYVELIVPWAFSGFCYVFPVRCVSHLLCRWMQGNQAAMLKQIPLFFPHAVPSILRERKVMVHPSFVFAVGTKNKSRQNVFSSFRFGSYPLYQSFMILGEHSCDNISKHLNI